ncbi:hypothetical protein MMC25_002987 [Agyrium rufum]|nr:hypothetical protein [Agyrium rufum]
MTKPSVHLTLPPASLFQFPPASTPSSLQPPTSDFTLARPFNIDPEWYNYLLGVEFPITIALVYAATVTVANRINTERGYKPWAFSKTRPFFYFVIAHNVFLAIYSAWTFVGMVNAAVSSISNMDGAAGVVDSLCKINGPRGLGSAATYNPGLESWGFTDRNIKLLDNGLPDSTDVGRIWNEGLAFYGWLFYLSKFYEVLDTVILLVKGKKSSILQTYHHAGAMIGMWAGIRYMSPPIWMFVLLNSGIHTAMYTYYTVSALEIRVRPALKQALTSAQIVQIVFGTSYALAHLFVSYQIPVDTPYRFAHNLSTAIPSFTSTATSAIASATSSVASIGLNNILKKIALRAAGEEGLAENVRNYDGQLFGVDAVKAIEVEKAQEQIRYKMEYPTVNCIDTSGQTFAILLNVLYLVPLTVLFVQYFMRSYLSISGLSNTEKLDVAQRSARKDIKESILESSAPENDNSDMQRPQEVQDGMDKAKAGARNAGKKADEKTKNARQQGQAAYEKGKEGAKDGMDKARGYADAAKSGVQDALSGDEIEKAKNYADEAKKGMQDAMSKGQDKTTEVKDEAKEEVSQAGDTVEKTAEDGKDAAKDKAAEAEDETKDSAAKGESEIKEGAAKGKDNAEQTAEKGEEKAKDAKETTEQKAEETNDQAQEKAEDSTALSSAESKPAPEPESSPDESQPEPESEPKDDGKDQNDSFVQVSPSSESEANAADGKPTANGDASAMEASIDEIKSEEENKAENELQPDGI